MEEEEEEDLGHCLDPTPLHLRLHIVILIIMVIIIITIIIIINILLDDIVALQSGLPHPELDCKSVVLVNTPAAVAPAAALLASGMLCRHLSASQRLRRTTTVEILTTPKQTVDYIVGKRIAYLILEFLACFPVSFSVAG